MSRKSTNLIKRNDLRTVPTATDANTTPSHRSHRPAGQEFKDGDFVIVQWLDRPGRSYEPMMPISEILESSSTEMMTSIGVIFDKPDFEEIVVIPHVAEMGLLPYVGTEFAESRGYGEVVLPYGYVLDIIQLLPAYSDDRPWLQNRPTTAEARVRNETSESTR